MSDRVVVIGDPNSVFVQTPVRYWRDRGVDAVILASRWKGPAVVDGDLPVIAAESVAPAWLHSAAHGLYPLLEAISIRSLSQEPDRVHRALQAWAHTAVPPSLAPPVFDALLIAAAADALDPVCVFGHEAFAHGLATSLCRAPRKALFAWGADVLQYAAMSDITHAMVRQALHGVHYVLTNSAGMEDALHERFALPRASIAQISYGVDRRQFSRAFGSQAHAIRSRYGIAAGARVVMNIRRFLPHWGSDMAWRVLRAVAEHRRDTHMILLGGSGSAPELERVKREAASCGLLDRITVMDGDVSLSTVAGLMSVADVSLSLVEPLEPVSWSVLQAAACGSALVLGDQRSYEDECERGLAAVRVPAKNVSLAAAATVSLLDDSARRAAMATGNDHHVSTHHDQDVHFARLLRIVAGAGTAERLLAAGTPDRSPKSGTSP